MKNSLEAAEKLSESLEGFTWIGFRGLRLKRSTLTGDLLLDNKNKFLLFNLAWLKLNTEHDIIVKLRAFVLKSVNNSHVLSKPKGNSGNSG